MKSAESTEQESKLQELACITAMDETSCVFDGVGNTSTVAEKGAVHLASTGHEKACITVILSASCDGKKKQPCLFFKGKKAVHKVQLKSHFMKEDLYPCIGFHNGYS